MRDQRARRTSHPALGTAGAVVLAAFVHFVLAHLSHKLSAAPESASFWIPAGVDVALVVLLGRRAWAGVLAGGALACLVHGASLGVALGENAGGALAAVAGAWVVARFSGPQGRVETRRDVLVIVLMAAPAAAAIAATAGAAVLMLGGSAGGAALLEPWGIRFLSNAAGLVVLTPAILILARHAWRPPSPARAAEAVGVLVALLVAGVAGGSDQKYLVFPVIILAALRFRLGGAALVSLLASVIAVLMAARGHDASGARDAALVYAQGFMTVSTLTGLLLAVANEEREAAVRRERSARRHMQAFMDHSPAVIFIKDLAGRHVAVNRRFADLHAPAGADLLGLTDAEIFPPEVARRLQSEDAAVVRSAEPRIHVDAADRPEGRRTYETVKFPVLDETGEITGVAGIATDVTDRIVAEREREEALRQLAHRALHDPLTGLPNRALLAERLEAALQRADEDGSTVAVLLVDLDEFKNVNDSFGHHTGDDLLCQIAPRLRAAVRPQDTVARFGGDEFVILCEGLAGPWEATDAARALAAAWAEPFRLGDDEVFVSGSTGIAVTRAGRADAGTLLREADAAMYRAKEAGRGQAELYDEVMRARAYDRLKVEADLRRALADGGISVAFQPILDLEHGRPVAVEVLARWNHPERGPISPAVFIPVAEESGLVGELGRHVLLTGCRQLARWRAEVPGAEDLQISINVSARQIARGELPGDVRDALRESGLPPHALALEVTESALMEESDGPGPVLASLRSLGVRIVLDDFGTGYSSLSYLRRFPLDGLKLDRSFVDGLGRPDAAAVVAAIIGMGTTLGLTLTAEGIETRAQAERLRELGCQRGQGYVLARPGTGEEAGIALAAGLRRRPSLAAGHARPWSEPARVT